MNNVVKFKSLSLKMTKLEVGLLLLNKKKNVKLGVDVRHGIASIWNCTHLLKDVFNLFVCKNLTLFLQFSFLYLISGCNSVWVQYRVNRNRYRLTYYFSYNLNI